MVFEVEELLGEVVGKVIPILANAAEHEVLDGGHCDI